MTVRLEEVILLKAAYCVEGGQTWSMRPTAHHDLAANAGRQILDINIAQSGEDRFFTLVAGIEVAEPFPQFGVCVLVQVEIPNPSVVTQGREIWARPDSRAAQARRRQA